MKPAEAFLKDQVPVALQTMIPETLRTAYAAAEELVKDTPVLQIPSAIDNRGRLIQWAVDFGFVKLVESGRWPYDFRWVPYERPTGRYLEIRPGHSVITISQVSDPKKQPRDVKFRENKRLNSQLWLTGLPDPQKFNAEEAPHILLLHGHQNLKFAYLGIPREEHHRGYYYKTSNLMLLPQTVAASDDPIENTDYDAVLTLKQEIDKWRRDNGI